MVAASAAAAAAVRDSVFNALSQSLGAAHLNSSIGAASKERGDGQIDATHSVRMGPAVSPLVECHISIETKQSAAGRSLGMSSICHPRQ